MIFDALRRRGNPTNAWDRVADLSLTVELFRPAINSVAIESRLDQLEFLGRSSSAFHSPLHFADLGLVIDSEQDGTFSGFSVVLHDVDGELAPFGGRLTVNGAAIVPTDLLTPLGEPYWVDTDEHEILTFFEYPTHEIQVEQSLEGVLQRIIVTSKPLLADAQCREDYGVDKPWPPA
ncbi:MAG: hypothetical protein NXI04_18085 [Planctomycetaceae bacterium]|nr:hypothetical protein [Planctomycetaceae bacterium]